MNSYPFRANAGLLLAFFQLVFFAALIPAQAQTNPGFQSPWVPSGSPVGPTDTNYWEVLDSLGQSQGGSAALAGSQYAALEFEHYTMTNGGDLSLQYWISVFTQSSVARNLTDEDIFTTNPITTDIYIAYTSYIGGFSTSGMDSVDAGTLAGLASCGGECSYGFLRRNRDGAPLPLSGIPQIWSICTPTGPYVYALPEEGDGYSSPFPIGAYGGSTGAGPYGTNVWFFLFTGVPPGEYTFYGVNASFYTPFAFSGVDYTVTNVVALSFTFDPQVGAVFLTDLCLIESPAADAVVHVGDTVPVHIYCGTSGTVVGRNWQQYDVSVNDVDITNVLFNWNTTTNLIDEIVYWVPTTPGPNKLILFAKDTETIYATNTVTINVLPTGVTPPAISTAAFSEGGALTIDISTATNTSSRVFASINLTDWQPIYTNVLGGTWQFTDTNAPGFTSRFYRVSTP